MAYQPKSYRKFVATAATATLVASAFAPFASAATDVPADSRYADAVNFLATKGVTGFADGTFKPSQNITRTDAAVMLVNVLGLDIEAAPASGFTDVPARATKHVNALKAEGITNGAGGGKFDAHSQITRGELAMWIYKAFDLQGSTYVNFTDVSERYYEAVAALVANGITNGKTATTFGTNQSATRGDYAIFLQRAFGASDVGVVASVKAINATTVEVTYKEAVKDIESAQYTIEGLEVKNAAIKQTDAKTVVLTTEAQTAGKTYAVKNHNTVVGTFTGLSAVIPTDINVVEKSQQGILGQQVTVKAQVTVKEGDSKAGIPVTFNVTSSNSTLNAPQVVEATTNEEGVATYTYTRYATTNDNVVAYATGDRTKFSTGTVYWAAATQLAIKDITEATTLVNGSKKVYEINSSANANGYVFVAFEENNGVTPDKAVTGVKVEGVTTYVLDASGKLTSTVATNAYPYAYTTGGKAVTAVKLDAAGKANLVVTGSNASVTPIVYANGFVDATKTLVGVDAAYSATLLQAKGSTVKFELKHELGLKIEAAGAQRAATYLNATETGGRDYTVTYTDKDGKAAAPGTKVKVAIDTKGVNGVLRVLDADNKEVAYTTSIATPGVRYYDVVVEKEGKAKFTVASTNVNDFVAPVAFIDNGKATSVGSLDTDDLQVAGEVTYFVGDVTYTAALSAVDAAGKPVTAVLANGVEYAEFRYTLVDQNGKPRSSTEATTVSFEVKAGTGIVKVGADTIQPGGTKTVNATIAAGSVRASVTAVAEAPSSVTVSATGSRAGVVLPSTSPASVTVNFSQYGTAAITGTATNVNTALDVLSINNVVYNYANSIYKQNGSVIDLPAFESLIAGNAAYLSITKDNAGVFTFNVIPAPIPSTSPRIVSAEVTALNEVTVTFSGAPSLPAATLGKFTFDVNGNGIIETGEVATGQAAGGTNQLKLTFTVPVTVTSVGTLTYTPNAVASENLTIGTTTVNNILTSAVTIAGQASGITAPTVALSANGVDSAQRVAKAQIISTAGITTAGNIDITLTATELVGSPLTLTIPVALNDTKEVVATKVRAALAGNANVADKFTVTGTDAEVIVTPKAVTDASNVTNTIALAIAASSTGGATGLGTTTTTGTVGTGALGVKEVNTIAFTTGTTVTTGNIKPMTVRVQQTSPTDLVGIDRLVSVAITTADNTNAAVATKVQAALLTDSVLASKFDITVSGGTVSLTNKVTGDVTTTITVTP